MASLHVLVLYLLFWHDAKGDNSGSIVDQVRTRIHAWHRQRPDLYDQADVDFVTKDDKLIRMAHNVKKDFNGTVQILVWRKDEAVSHMTAAEFPAEVFHVGSHALVGQDKQGDVALWGRAKNLFFRSSMTRLNRRFHIYWFERALREGKGLCLFVIDAEGVGWQNADYSMVDTMFNVVDYYYPDQIKKALLLNFPPLFNPLFTFTKWVAGTQAGKVTTVTTKDLMTYLRKEQIPKYIGGSNPIDFSAPPNGSVSYKQKAPPAHIKKEFDAFLEATKQARGAA